MIGMVVAGLDACLYSGKLNGRELTLTSLLQHG